MPKPYNKSKLTHTFGSSNIKQKRSMSTRYEKPSCSTDETHRSQMKWKAGTGTTSACGIIAADESQNSLMCLYEHKQYRTER